MSDEHLDLKKGVDFIGNTVVFFCHDGNGRMLMAKRSQNCRDEQGRWDVGGGAMRHGEEFEEAVRREVMEEYNVEAHSVDLIHTANVIRDNNGVKTHWIAHLHVVHVANPDEVKINAPEDVDELKWVTLDDIPDNCHSAFGRLFPIMKPHIFGE